MTEPTLLSSLEWLKTRGFLSEVRRHFGPDAKITIRPNAYHAKQPDDDVTDAKKEMMT